jgi:hypothetical protein
MVVEKKIITEIMEYLKGKYHCTIDLLIDWFGIGCVTTDNFCFYLQNRLIQTSQTGGQWYSGTLWYSLMKSSKKVRLFGPAGLSSIV